MSNLKTAFNVLIITFGIILAFFAVYGYALWTDASLDQVFQMITGNDESNFPMPLSVLFMIIFFPIVLLINIVMLFV